MDSAILSACGQYRYVLERDVQPVNSRRCEKRSHDTKRTRIRASQRLASDHQREGVADPVGPANDDYLVGMIETADLLVPCWGRTDKVPKALRDDFAAILDLLVLSGKPVMTFGLTKDGSPAHPLMLPYSTKLQPWTY